MRQSKPFLQRTCVALLGAWAFAVGCTPNENPAKSPEQARAESREDMNRTLQDASDDADRHLEQMQDETGTALSGKNKGEPTEQQADTKQRSADKDEVPAATAMPKESDEPKQKSTPKQTDDDSKD